MGLFGGKLPQLEIRTERPDGVYYAGETVRASITVTAEDGAKFKEIRAGLLLEEKYQVIERQRDTDGDVDYNRVWRTNEQWAAREQLAAGSLPKGFRQTFNFEWRLPDHAQPSCQGKIVSARWLVKATVDRTLARDVNEEAQLFVVRPAPAQASPGGEFAGENSAADIASMRFQLPRLEFVQGETVTGRLLVEPRQDLSPRSVQIALLRHEVVQGGDRTNVEDVVEARQVHAAQLHAGRPAAFDFSLEVPAKWCPAYESGSCRVEWRVAATLDLAWKRDVEGWQVLRVYNGAAPVGQQPTAAAQTPTAAAEAPPASFAAQGQGMPQPSGDLRSHAPQPAGAQADDATSRFCRNCGTPLAAAALFCGNCGTQVLRA